MNGPSGPPKLSIGIWHFVEASVSIEQQNHKGWVARLLRGSAPLGGRVLPGVTSLWPGMEKAFRGFLRSKGRLQLPCKSEAILTRGFDALGRFRPFGQDLDCDSGRIPWSDRASGAFRGFHEEEPVRGVHLFGDFVAAPLGAFGPFRGGLELSGSWGARVFWGVWVFGPASIPGLVRTFWGSILHAFGFRP